MPMKRCVVFLPEQAVTACETLAERYGATRSEVVRVALAEGLAPAVPVLERLREVRLLEAAGAGAERWRISGTRKRSGRGRPRKALDPDRAVSLLLDYGRAVRAAEPERSRDDVSATLRLHALVIGVEPEYLDDVVLEALSRTFGEPQIQAVADPSQPPE